MKTFIISMMAIPCLFSLLAAGCSRTPVHVIVVPYDVRGVPGMGGIPNMLDVPEPEERKI